MKMTNYIKSELYRVSRSKAVYLTAAIIVGIPPLLNLSLWWFSKGRADFSYGTTSFSYSNLIANPMIYCYVVCAIAAMIYESGKKNGNIRNTIAYGISRTEIFIGKCIVSLLTALTVLVIVVPVYIASAELLLQHDGPAGMDNFLMEIPAVSLIAMASLILYILIMELIESTFAGIVVLCFLLSGLPTVLFHIGLAYEPLFKVAMWLPDTFFKMEVKMNMTEYAALWDIPAGMAKCLLTGAIGVVVFSISGVTVLRNRDI